MSQFYNETLKYQGRKEQEKMLRQNHKVLLQNVDTTKPN